MSLQATEALLVKLDEHKVPSIYYVSTFSGVSDPHPPFCDHMYYSYNFTKRPDRKIQKSMLNAMRFIFAENW